MQTHNSNFHEIQRFRQLWLWVIILGVSAVSIYSFIQQIGLGVPFGNSPAPDGAVPVILITFGIGLPWVFYKANLTIEVRPDGLYYRYSPFLLKTRMIPLEDIASFKAHQYSPIKDYGGWGIKYGRTGKAYNVSGNRGVLISLTNGENILFGSARPEEFAEALLQVKYYS
ncbi:DUF6141 family protein [Chloroflexota bacterium]